mgnify:CR=1 FL=1
MNRRRNKQRDRSIFGPGAAGYWNWDGPLEVEGGFGGATLGRGFRSCPISFVPTHLAFRDKADILAMLTSVDVGS